MSAPARSPAPAATGGEIEARAADWLARRNGGFTPLDESALTAWLAADVRHAAAYAEMERAWSALNFPRRAGGQPAADWLEAAAARRARERRRPWALASLGAAAAIVFGFTFMRPAGVAVRPEAAARAESRPTIRTLADGSQVALKPGAEIEVAFTATTRGVRLVRGEALFTVAKNSARPFVVSARGVVVRAVGTEFSVRHDAAEIAVLVTEGRVAVSRTGETTATAMPPAEELHAAAGERVLAPTAAPAAPLRLAWIAPADLAAALAWRGRRLEFSDTPLAEAIARFNREGPPALALADPALGARTITGVIWADDSDGFVRLLETGFDLVAERDGAVVRLRSRR